MSYYIDVVFPLAHPQPLTYVCKTELHPGCRVRAPLKGKERVGFVVGKAKEISSQIEYKEAVPFDTKPIVPENVMKLIEWTSSYYLEPPGIVWAAALPPFIRRGKEIPGTQKILVAKPLTDHVPTQGLTEKQIKLLSFLIHHGKISVSSLEKVWGFSRSVLKALERKKLVALEAVEKNCDYKPQPVEENITLTDEQRHCIETISTAFNQFKTFLIYGVTASGKTEIYRQLARKVVEKGGNVLVLVPEISLTPHYIKRFESMFREKLTVLHSGLSDAERARQWLGVEEGRYKVVIGTRSAIFAPFERCNLIIVDEEHDMSYKQQESPRYNARDLAVVRGYIEKCPVVLGSATPSIETYFNAKRNKYYLLTLKKRLRGSLPDVVVVDMKEEKGIFSRPLIEELEKTIERKETALLLLNRRGYSRILFCRKCGTSIKCPNCDVFTCIIQNRRWVYFQMQLVWVCKY